MKKKMKQSTLLLILSSLSILAFMFMAACLICYSKVSGKINEANSQRFDLTYNANRFTNGSSYLTNEIRAYAVTGDQDHYKKYWNEINTLKNREAGIKNMEDIGLTQDEQAMVDKMMDLSNSLIPLEENAMMNVANGNAKAARDYVFGDEYNASLSQINQIKSEFLDTLSQRTLNKVNSLISISRIILCFFAFTLVLVALLQIINYRLCKHRILKPIIKIRDEMGQIASGSLSSPFSLEPDTSEIGMLVGSIHTTKEELKKYIQDIASKLSLMAGGNMDQTVEIDYLGEFHPIKESLNKILDSLNHALYRISDSAALVSSNSANVASTSQSVSHGAAQQAAAVEELSASADSISVHIKAISDNAECAKACSVEAAGKLIEGTEIMNQLSEAMSTISGSSNQISGIIKTIEDISFQTNILALNAAVEAARAGAAGKGFAVVADEVRSLAAKSSEAAKDTTTLIENTLNLVEKAVGLSTATMSTLQIVGVGAKESTTLVDEIAAASAQQKESVLLLTNSIRQISQVVQANMGTAEESSASSEELAGQARVLQEAMGLFHLRT